MKDKMKKYINMKKTVSILCLVFYIGIVAGSSIEVYASEFDNSNARLQYSNAYFDKEYVKVGQEVTFWVKAKPEEEFDRVEASFKCDGETFGYNKIVLNYDEVRNEYKTTIKITDDMPSGNWNAEVITYTGTSGSGNVYNGKLEVRGTSKTIEDYKVKVDSVKINNNSLKFGDYLTLEMKLNSNIKRDILEASIRYEGNISSDYFYMGIQDYNANTKIIKGSKKITTRDGSGVKNIKEIRVKTSDYDVYVIKPEEDILKTSKITIKDEDIKNTEVKSVNLENRIYRSGDIVKIRLMLNNHREEKDYIRVWFDDYKQKVSTDTSKYVGNGEYELELKVPYYIESGKYILREIEIIDSETEVSDKVYYTGLIKSFNVNAIGNVENEVPSFESVSISKDILTPGEEFNILVSANDRESYINSIVACYEHEKTKVKIYKDFSYNRIIDKYEATIKIDDTINNGKWILNELIINDINGNVNKVSKEVLEKGNFQVVNSKGILELNKPIIKSITTDKKYYKSGEVAKITADIDKKGMEQVAVIGYIGDKDETVYFNYNKNTGKYESLYKVKAANQSNYKIDIKVHYGYSNKVLTSSILINTNNELIVDEKPILIANDKKTRIGNEFDIFEGIKATDKEDGDITSRVSILKSNLDLNKTGVYDVTYLITDTYGNRVTKAIKVTVLNGVKITEMKTDKPNNSAPNTKIKVTTEALGENLQYEFFVKPVNGEWTKLAKMGSKNYAYWTPTTSGEYLLRVRVKYEGSSNNYDDYKDLKFNIKNKMQIDTLTTDKPSEGKVNEQITIKATSNVKDAYYEFFVKESNDSKWTKLKGMGPKNYVYWTPTEMGEYTIRVRGKNSTSDAIYEAYKDIKYIVNSNFTITEFNSNKQGIKTGEEIKLTSSSNDKNGRYEFFVKKDNGSWSKIKNMGRESFATYTPSKPGVYTFMVRGKNTNSTQNYDSYKTVKVKVYEPIKIKTLTTNKPSGSKVGSKITITAGPLVEDNYYEFYVKGSNDSKWTKLKGLGPKNYAYWTPEKAGQYTIRVRAKNVNSSATYDSYKDIKFEVKS